MIDQKLVRRLQARLLGRAVLIRETSDLSADPDRTIGIATIKIVTEEHIQALAFGELPGEPLVITRLNPLGRDASDLEPFADWLIRTYDDALRTKELVRVWLPHGNTLKTLDVLGHRYEHNKTASPSLQRMGQLCRIFAREARHDGQQAVAVACDLLNRHIATGQAPAEDAHLGAVLAWVNPSSLDDTVEISQARAREPATGILANYPGRKDDEQVEMLRRAWKKAPRSARSSHERRIRSILASAAAQEWALLDEAWRAFWSLGLRTASIEECTTDSLNRTLRAIEYGTRVPKNLGARTRDLEEREHSRKQLLQMQLKHDAVIRANARARGRCLMGVIVSVNQPRPRCSPCNLVVFTEQRELRLRADDNIFALETNIVGRVRTVTANGRGSIVTLEIKKGFRSIENLVAAGGLREWLQFDSFPLFLKLKTLKDLPAPWMLSEGVAAPARSTREQICGDLLAAAELHLRGASQ
jgi:hypothetical protein